MSWSSHSRGITPARGRPRRPQLGLFRLCLSSGTPFTLLTGGHLVRDAAALRQAWAPPCPLARWLQVYSADEHQVGVASQPMKLPPNASSGMDLASLGPRQAHALSTDCRRDRHHCTGNIKTAL